MAGCAAATSSGAPGLGKTAVCLTALHDSQVVQRFGARRWFVRCDGARSAEELLAGLAAELNVVAEGSPAALLDGVCGELDHGPGVMVLDNFETPWFADPLVVQATKSRMHGPGRLQLVNDIQLWFRFKQRDLDRIMSRHERYDTRKLGGRIYLSRAGSG